jgi:8-oxo-dGTP diphosphatase
LDRFMREARAGRMQPQSNAGTGPRPVEIGIAVILDQGQVLVTTRGSLVHLAGRDEFPGGHREPGESIEDCVRREAREEVGLEVDVIEPLEDVVVESAGRSLRLRFFACRLHGPREEGFRIGRHRPRWVDVDRLEQLRWPPANRGVLGRLPSFRFTRRDGTGTADPSP